MTTVFVFDLETYRFGQGNLAPRVVCLSWATDEGSGLVTRDEIPALLLPVLREGAASKKLLVGHNVAYDAACLLADFPSLRDAVWDAYAAAAFRDTKIREQLLSIAEGVRPGFGVDDSDDEEEGTKPAKRAVGYSLADCAWRYFHEDMDKTTWRTGYAELAGIPLSQWPAGAREYAIKDAETTRRLYLAQAERAKKVDCPMSDEALQTQAALALHLASVWGVRTDLTTVQQLWGTTQQRLSELRKQLVGDGLVVPKGKKLVKDTKRIQDEILAHYPSLEEVPTTAKGAVSRTKLVLETCNYEPFDRLIEYSALEKSGSTYVRKLYEGTTYPIHARFDVLGAASGRTSCSSPNLQNMPRLPGVRECFVPRPGRVFLSCDYDSQELRTLGAALLRIVGWSRLAEAYQQDPDFDPHTRFGGRLLGLDYEAALARKKAKDPELKAYRQRAKACFHPDTEILTRDRGWIRIGELTYEDHVASAYPGTHGNATIRWERPLALTERSGLDRLFHVQSKGIDLRVTADHRMLVFGQDGNPAVVTPDKVTKARWIAGAGVLSRGALSRGTIDGRVLSLAVATQADGSYTSGGIRFGFVKRRKIDRLRKMLHPFSSSDWSESARGGVTSFRLKGELAQKIKRLLDEDKTMPWWWLGLPPSYRQLILEEARHWDAHELAGGRRYLFASAFEKNAQVLQALAAVSGRKSRMTKTQGVWVLSVGDHAATRIDSAKVTEIPYNDRVVCLSVPSSFVLVRDGGVPVVCGQCNFGFPGGMGAEKFRIYAKGYGVTLAIEEAMALRASWFEEWPEMRDYFRFVDHVSANGAGRMVVPTTGRIRGLVTYCECANGFFQSTAADISKVALFEVARRCYADKKSALYGARVWNFIHDSIELEVEEDRANAAAQELEKVMVEAGELLCPEVPFRASPALMRRWSKDAEAVYNSAGELIPWEDADT